MSDDIESTVGDGAKNVNAGKGNRQEITENNADNNVTINIPMPTWNNPPVPVQGTPDRRHIPLELERELRQNLSSLNDTLVKLSGTVEVNNELTKININLLKEQVGQARALSEKTQEMVSKGLAGVNLVMPEKQTPSWVWPIVTVLILIFTIACSVIAWKLATGGA